MDGSGEVQVWTQPEEEVLHAPTSAATYDDLLASLAGASAQPTIHEAHGVSLGVSRTLKRWRPREAGLVYLSS